jgi:hypothetical protein
MIINHLLQMIMFAQIDQIQIFIIIIPIKIISSSFDSSLNSQLFQLTTISYLL